MAVLIKIFDAVLLIIDYPFVFYYTIQKKSKDGLSHHGKAFALILYFLMFATVTLEYPIINFGIAWAIFLIYIFFRFFYKDRVKAIVTKYEYYNSYIILALKIYSIIIIFIPIYILVKSSLIQW